MAHLLGSILVLVGLFMLVPLAWALATGEPTVRPFLAAAAVCLVSGLLLRGRRGDEELELRTALGVVAIGWAVAGLAGSLPFVLAGAMPHWSDAVFESFSGFTTTGATVIAEVESQPRSLLLWRSLLQWLGGVGIIVLFVSVFPRLGVGGIQLFRAEITGPSPEKVLPRVAETGRLLWIIYLGLTTATTVALVLAGVNWFDAINHAMTAVSTGGYSTRNDGIGAFASPVVHWVLTVGMFLGGMNFFLQYRVFRFGDWQAVRQNREFWVYVGLLLGAGLLVTADLWMERAMRLSDAWRMGLFHAVSIMTTTGYVSDDYGTWPHMSRAILFMLMFIGGSAQSTAGGPKVIRLAILFKHGIKELEQLMHPRSVRALRIGDKAVADRTFYAVVGFVFLYIAIWLVSTVILAATGLDLITAASAAITSLSNVGPGFGKVGPAYTFASLTPAAKLYLSFLMLVGRLEIMSVLILFHPAFWGRRNLRRPPASPA
ncbi:MAG: TrkH family potassium uptake protein [Firmicutes bacterium]|nr:TrkH family potassium uptake protein [Bacillota bacterium]